MSACGSGDSDSGSSGGSASGGCGSSTPFLQQTDQAGVTHTLNDVMVGNPSSLFIDPSVGANAYTKGKIGFDIYPVAIRDNREKNTTFSFNLKEVEYETSTLYDFSYTTTTVPRDRKVCTDHTHQTLYTTTGNTAIKKVAGELDNALTNAVFKENITDLAFREAQPVKSSLRLDAGDEVSFTINTAISGPTYLATAAFFHTLHTDGVDRFLPALSTAGRPSPYKVSTPSFFKKHIPGFAALTAFAAALLPFGSITVDDNSLVGLSHKYPEVQADHPSKSLYFYYKDVSGAWKEFAVIHPRFKLTHQTIIAVPEAAFSEQTEVEIKIVSNTTHYIYAIGMAQDVQAIELGQFSPVTGVLNGKDSVTMSGTEKLVTKPGDNFEFQIPVDDLEATHICFRLHGHYSPLRCTSIEEAQDWWNKLTETDRSLLLA